jgi:tetratricopeptide (TPR) repeat protein
MGLTVSTRPPRRRRLSWGFIGAAVLVAALVGLGASTLVPSDAPRWITGLVQVGSLVATLVVEYFVGRALERRERRRQLADAVAGLRARAPRGPATLLSPHRAAELGLPFLGREEEIAELLGWCAGAETRYRLITGPGGAGKTRLAGELQRLLRGSSQHWETLFLGTDSGLAANAVAALREHAGDRPVLIVVDYAENRSDLRELLEDAFEDPGTVRVLMLARQAGNWWDRLTNIPGGVGGALAAGYRDEDLPDVGAVPQAVVDRVAAGFAAHLGAPIPRIHVEATGQPRVLDLTAIALVAVLNSLQNEQAPLTGQVSAGQVFAEILRHESEHHWQATAREVGIEDDLTEAMRRVLIAAVALLGAPDEHLTMVLVDRVLATFPDERSDAASVARWLRRTYPATDEATKWIEPVMPDRVAEHLVVETLTASPRPVAQRVHALLEDLSGDQAVHAMTVLARAATDPARSDDQQGVIRVLADHLGKHLPSDSAAVARVLEVIPWPSVVMSHTAVAVARSQLDLLVNAPGANEMEVAKAASNLGEWFFERGLPNEALPATQYAVDLFDRLGQTDSGQHLPNLAGAVSNLGVHFLHLGRLDDALSAAQRAVDLYEQISPTDRARYEPELAGALSNLGAILIQRGELGDALPTIRRVVELYEQLAYADAARYEPKVAGALNNLGILFLKLSRPGDALSAAQRSVDLFERLAMTDPDRFRPDFAMSLENLGTCLPELGRLDEAIPVLERSVRLYERLAQINRDRFEAHLAHTVAGLARRFFEAERPFDAVSSWQRAVALYERPVRINPERYEPDLAHALGYFGLHLDHLGRPDQALPVTQRAVEVYEKLAQTDPDRYEPALTLTLDNLVVTLSRLGRLDDALPVAERTVALYERYASQEPIWYRADAHRRMQLFVDGLNQPGA